MFWLLRVYLIKVIKLHVTVGRDDCCVGINDALLTDKNGVILNIPHINIFYP